MSEPVTKIEPCQRRKRNLLRAIRSASVPLLVVSLAVAAGPAYQIDLSRYFTSATVEQTQREKLLADVAEFIEVPATSLSSPRALLAWLLRRDSLYKDLQKHDIYVYLRAEENIDDRTDNDADAALAQAMEQVDAAARRTISDLGPTAVRSLIERDGSLVPHRYFVESVLRQAGHADQNQNAALAALTKLKKLADSYKSMLPPEQPPPPSEQTQDAARHFFDAKWAPYLKDESAFAGLLIPIVQLQDSKAQLEKFGGAPEAAYFFAGLTDRQVHGVVAAVRRSRSCERYEMVVATAAARRLRLPLKDVRPWNLDAPDAYRPPPAAFGDAVTLILAAEKSMGAEYAGQFARLFDPASQRVELCESGNCDHAGFSVGYAGAMSGLFYGSYDGSTNSIRALAHEGGHAVHREFMNENQPLAAYNSGPPFLFESFAIFNELLVLDHRYRTAASPAEEAYYLHKFLEDATFQVWGSAKETDLEESIYAGVRKGILHNAMDLDALTLKTLSQYDPAPALSPEMRVYWARDRLYFTDRLYDVNYLFAGLLALQYLRQFESDPQYFSGRYVALLKNGFTDTPQALEERFLGIDLDNTDRLVGDAAKLIDRRASILRDLYVRLATTTQRPQGKNSVP